MTFWKVITRQNTERITAKYPQVGVRCFVDRKLKF